MSRPHAGGAGAYTFPPMPIDEQLRRFLRVSAIGYALWGLNLLFRRRKVEEDMRRIDRQRKPPEELWPVLSVAYMGTIAAVAWLAGRDRKSAAELATPLLVAKGVSSSLFAYQFIRTRRASYALSALTDGALLAATAALIKKVRGPQLRAVETSNVHQLRTAETQAH